MKYLRLITLRATAPISDGGIFYYAGTLLVRFARLFLLLFIWQGILGDSPDPAMTVSQAQTYTLLAAALAPLLNIETPTATLFDEGSLLSNALRPMPIISQLIAETVGGWILQLLIVSVPVFLIAPMFGVVWVISADTLLFLVSLALSVALGFAIDFLYSALTIKVKYASYTIYLIRGAVAALFTGAIIPLAAFPSGIGYVFSLLPFASLAGAPLSIYTGLSPAVPTILLQVFWTTLLVPLAGYTFSRCQERMVSYGG